MLRKAIRQERVNKGMSRGELAEKAGIPADLVRQIEEGEDATMSSRMLISLLKVLNLKIDELI